MGQLSIKTAIWLSKQFRTAGKGNNLIRCNVAIDIGIRGDVP